MRQETAGLPSAAGSSDFRARRYSAETDNGLLSAIDGVGKGYATIFVCRTAIFRVVAGRIDPLTLRYSKEAAARRWSAVREQARRMTIEVGMGPIWHGTIVRLDSLTLPMVDVAHHERATATPQRL